MEVKIEAMQTSYALRLPEPGPNGEALAIYGPLWVLEQVKGAFDRVAELERINADHCTELAIRKVMCADRDRFREALERISMMRCRCIDNGQPCPGCAKAGREAPAVAYAALNPEPR